MTDANGVEYERGDQLRYVGPSVSMLGIVGRVVVCERGLTVYVPTPPHTWRTNTLTAEPSHWIVTDRFNRNEGLYKPLDRQKGAE